MRVDALLVEDNRADVFMLTEALKRAGLDYHLHLARDGQEALDFLNRRDPAAPGALDLIILDLNLPRVNGFEILHYLRGRSDLRDVPAVILTTSAWEHESAKLAGFDREAFFQKPSLLADWISMVQAIDVYRRKWSRSPNS
jgi:CheY-like chemotaxis protein